jgi:hypothetical protein
MEGDLVNILYGKIAADKTVQVHVAKLQATTTMISIII